MIALEILLLLAGLALVVFGADALVDGASGLARRAGISEFVIGLTIVGFGTSCPELVVSLTGAIDGSSDISIGNVIGSNIFNTLLILGLTAVIMPLEITSKNRRVDLPIMLFVTSLLVPSAFIGQITYVNGLIFLLLFAGYIFYCFKTDGAQNNDVQHSEPVSESFIERIASHTAGAVVLVLCGLAGLIFGGRLFVDSACDIARAVGVSDKFIAITVLAAGTSMPELATSIVAAAKHKGQLALGNIVGSNIFNILLILGVSSLFTPLSMSGMDMVDLGTLLLSSLLLFISTLTWRKDRIDRAEGVFMLLIFIAYYINLFTKI